MDIRHKTHAGDIGAGLEFILSDETPDRMGDVISASGWSLENFKKNPIALFNHRSDFPIGKWKGLRAADGELRGHLELAPEGTSDRIDEIRRLIDAGILKAVSVGFKPIESEPRKSGGDLFTKQELIETSLVSVPANPNALAVAKSLGISGATLDIVFAEQGTKDGVVAKRGQTGKQAVVKSTDIERRAGMPPLTQRIKDAQISLVALRDQYTEHLKTIDDENPTAEQMTISEEFDAKIEAKERNLKNLQAAEKRIAVTVEQDTANEPVPAARTELPVSGRVWAQPAKKVKPVDYIYRALCVQIKHHMQEKRRPIVEVLKDTYGEDEPTKATLDWMTRSVVVPAVTTTSAWAQELVTTGIADFMESLVGVSIYAALAAKGSTFTFGRNGIVSMPRRDATPNMGGGFVLQGAAIPVQQAAFSTITLTPKKVAIISTFTREIAEHSTPAIETLIRQAITEDTAGVIDGVLLDNGAASATRPAGLLNGVGATGATQAGGIAAVIGDIKNLTSLLITGTKGRVRSPVWLMSPGDALAIQLTQAAAGGDLPFRDELNAGTLAGFPVIKSTNMTADTMILLDAADFVTATGDTPNFSVSDQATLHMETSATELATVAGPPNTVAAPIRSLWQTDTLGVRMIMDLNWALRRTGVIVWTQTMTWN